MSYVPLENLIDKADNNLYKLVIIASRRALELAEGSQTLVEKDPRLKTTTVALNEIAAGKVKYKKD